MCDIMVGTYFMRNITESLSIFTHGFKHTVLKHTNFNPPSKKSPHTHWLMDPCLVLLDAFMFHSMTLGAKILSQDKHFSFYTFTVLSTISD